jgi:hypothetical protein
MQPHFLTLQCNIACTERAFPLVVRGFSANAEGQRQRLEKRRL